MPTVKTTLGNWQGAILWIGLAGLVGYLDFVTGAFVSLTLFYMIPVVGASWFTGWAAAVVVAATAGAASLVAELLLLSGNSEPTLFWNTASRTVVLLVAGAVVHRVRVDRDALRALDVQRTHLLQLLDRGLAGPAKEIVELLDHWDGGIDQLRAMLRPRAESIGFLARDFTEMIRLQRGQPRFSRAKLDLIALIEEMRVDQMRQRSVIFVGPSERLNVLADKDRLRHGLSLLLGLLGPSDELFLSLSRADDTAELVISSDSAAVPDGETGTEEVSLSTELAQLLFASQGGRLGVLRNPLTRSLRLTVHLPVAP
jgi:hypothetical protein